MVKMMNKFKSKKFGQMLVDGTPVDWRKKRRLTRKKARIRNDKI